jgi:hypothetical protein
MDTEELQARLHAVSVDIPQNTLKRWAYQGLIPRPHRYKHGKGSGKKGRAVSWSEGAVAEAAAVWAIRHSPHISMLPKRQLIPYIKHSVAHIYGEPSFAYALPSDAQKGTYKDITTTFGYDQYTNIETPQPDYTVWDALLKTWIVAKEKAKCGWSIKAPAKVIFHWTQKAEPYTYDLSKISLEDADSDEIIFLFDEVDARKKMWDLIRPMLLRNPSISGSPQRGD